MPPSERQTTELIRLDNAAKRYGSGETAVRALDGVNLVVRQGEYCSIMGVSGSGKSTAMNVIGCLDCLTSGRYFFDGRDVSQLDADTLASIRNRKIGFVFQQFHLLPQLTALENVAMPMVYAGTPAPERRSRATEALQRVGLGDRLGNRPNQLSGGQQQRVAIARAIINRPLLLLADEPTGALDSQTAREVLAIFADLNADGITVVMVTHATEVAREAERILWFRDGRLLSDRADVAELPQLALAPEPEKL